MIDLKKEREEFIKVYTEIYSEHDQLWQGWKKRAELAQAEINKEREKFTEYYVDTAHLEDEITKLKQKLARYEHPDYVLVPREPTEEMVELGEDILSLDNDAENIYKAMIEAVEKEND